MRSTLLTLIVYPALAISLSANDQIAQPDIHLTTIVKSYSDRQPFSSPLGIFFDSDKREIYLADAGNHQVGIFDMKGLTLWTFKHWVTDSRSDQRVLGDPHSVVVTASGDIIISDNKADYLEVFDYRGNPMQRIEPDEYPETGPFRGACLALDKAGNLYIGTKTEKSEIIKLDPDYRLIMRFGHKGDEPSDFGIISGLWVDSDGDILVTDAQSVPVLKKFDPTGQYLGGFGDHTIEKNDFSLPNGVVATSGGRIWIADQLRQVVKCLTEDGQYITMIGGLGQKPGDMYYPSAIASDGDSLLIVAEKNGNRFQQFIVR